MRSSLKRIFAGALVVAMLVTTHSFNSLAVTLDTLVTKESNINQERNKDNQTKYFEQLLNEKNQLLMKGDEGDGSVLTTMPAEDNKEKHNNKDTETTKEKKEVVITTMPSDDKTTSDNITNSKTEEEAEEDDENNNDEATEAVEDANDDNNKQNNDDIKIEIDIDNEDIEDEKDFVVDDTPLTKDNIQEDEEKNVDVDADVDVYIDTATDSEIIDISDGIFGDSDITFLGGYINVDYVTYKEATNGDSRVYTIPITKAFRNYLIDKVKSQIDVDVIHFDKNIIEYDDFLNEHSESELIRFMTSMKAVNEDTGEKELIGSSYNITSRYNNEATTFVVRDKNGNIIHFLTNNGTGAVSMAHTGMYLTRNSDNSIAIHFVQRANEFLNSFEQYAGPDSRAHVTIPKYKVKIAFSTKETSKVFWNSRGGNWINTSKMIDTYPEEQGVPASSLPGKGDVKKDKYSLAGWKMYHSYTDCWDDKNGTVLDNGIPAGTWDDIWLGAIWIRSNVDIGDEVVFGKYYKYAGVNDKYPLEWIVTEIDTQSKKAKLISKYAIDAQPVITSEGDSFNLFTDTYLYRWLNGNSFYDSSFSNEEKNNILTQTKTIEQRGVMSEIPHELIRPSDFDETAYKNTLITERVTLPNSGELQAFRSKYGVKATDYVEGRKKDIAHKANDPYYTPFISNYYEWTANPSYFATDTHTKLMTVSSLDTVYNKRVYDSNKGIYFVVNYKTESKIKGTQELLVRPMIWVNLDYNFETISDTNSKRTKSIKIPKELIYRKDGFNTAPKAHVIRPKEAEDFYGVLGLKKEEINSINLGWDSNHRPKEAYEIIDYYSDLRVTGDWRGQLNEATGRVETSLDPVEANTVNAALLYDEQSKKYDVYLFGMYALWSLDGKSYGIYWDLSDIEDEIEKDTGIKITKHNSKVNWVVGNGATWINENAKFETYEEGTAHALPTAKDIRMVGHSLEGWYINSDKDTVYTTIPETQTGKITLTAKWVVAKIDLPLSMIITKDNNGDIYIKPDKTKWKSQLGLDSIKDVESVTIDSLDTKGKTLVSTIYYISTELRGHTLQEKVARALRNGYGLSDNSYIEVKFDSSTYGYNYEKDYVYDSTFDLISVDNMCVELYVDNDGKYYIDFKNSSALRCNQNGQREGANIMRVTLTQIRKNLTETITTVHWDLSDIDINANEPNPTDDYQEGYDITWVLGEGKFKDEYKSYENALHKTTEDFILPGADTLDAPYRRVLKEWTIGGVATTSISKEIHSPVTVTAVWTRSVDNFESYSIGKYKLSSLDTEEEETLEWIILDKVDGKLLLTTKNIIDNKSYDTNGSAKFENSTISTWLNTDFYNNVFNEEQKANILKEGKDKVFLLTVKEANEFFVNDIQRTAKATDHALHMDNGGEKLDTRNGLSGYWLMTNEDGSKVPYVNKSGVVDIDGIDVTSKNIGVRPCVWVSEAKIVDIKMNPMSNIFNAINEQLEHFRNFMNSFFGKGK